MIDELYPLYLAVHNRSKLHFEKLTPAFFCRPRARAAGSGPLFRLAPARQSHRLQSLPRPRRDHLRRLSRPRLRGRLRPSPLLLHAARHTFVGARAGTSVLSQQPAKLRAEASSRVRTLPARSLREAHQCPVEPDFPLRSALPSADETRSGAASVSQRQRALTDACHRGATRADPVAARSSSSSVCSARRLRRGLRARGGN